MMKIIRVDLVFFAPKYFIKKGKYIFILMKLTNPKLLFRVNGWFKVSRRSFRIEV